MTVAGEHAEGRLAEGVARHHAGDVRGAFEAYMDVLRSDPAHLPALLLGAVAAGQTGDPGTSLRLADQALRLDAASIPALVSRGNALSAFGRFEAAVAAFTEAATRAPRAVEAWHNRGRALLALGRHQAAIDSFDRALALDPTLVAAEADRGRALLAAGRAGEALRCLDLALTVWPDDPSLWSDRGGALLALGRPVEALAEFERLSRRFPGDAAARYHCGLALQRAGRHDEAVAAYGAAIRLEPRRAGAWINQAASLIVLNRPEPALESAGRAIALAGPSAELLANRAPILIELGRFDAARDDLDRAIAAAPHLASPRHTRALLRLLLGDFTGGLADHEWRLAPDAGLPAPRPPGTARWHGDMDCRGRTILVQAEQGLGDTIQFSRYVPLLAARGARVVLECPSALQKLLGRLPGLSGIAAPGGAAPGTDLHCPMMSLPLEFGTSAETIPCAVPYLAADPGGSDAWRRRLGDAKGPRIGLVWSGSRTNERDAKRSLPLAALDPLLSRPATWIAVQKDCRPADRAALARPQAPLWLGEALRDFDDTAALLVNLDLVITVDTAMAHLAGALGRPVWVLLPAVPDWRWQLAREDSPWYPTARLFRQRRAGDWADVVARVDAALTPWLSRAAR